MKATNVIFIGIDTLRADHLSYNGYGRKTSPNIDALASESIDFKNCFSQAPITAPSFASIFTSLYPLFHGVVENMGKGVGWKMRPDVPTLAEVLNTSGYRTCAFTEGGNLSKMVGIHRGFDKYETEPSSLSKGDPHPVFSWLSENYKSKFFLFFHTFAVHAPYLPPKPFNTLFRTKYEGPLPRSIEEYKEQSKSAKLSIYEQMQAEKHKSEAIEHLQALYDGSIAYMDEFIGRLLKHISSLGLLENTLIIFTSDHGEEFMEHGGIYHRGNHDEVLHVPLLIRMPGGASAGEKIHRVVRSIDISPTILEHLEITAPASFQGKSLFLEITRPAPSQTRYNKFSLRTEHYRYIFAETLAKIELYNMLVDPGAHMNIAAYSKRLIERLHAEYTGEITAAKLVLPPHSMFILRGHSEFAVEKIKAKLW